MLRHDLRLGSRRDRTFHVTAWRAGRQRCLEGARESEDEGRRPRTRMLPDSIYDALRLFKGSTFCKGLYGDAVHSKFAELKMASADRCPRALGSRVKTSEIQFHHEVTNQFLWNQF